MAGSDLHSAVALLDYLETRVAYFDRKIEQIAESEIYAPSVHKLRALKGIGTLGAMLLIAEITDFRRFASPRALMAFLGLIPSENSSGNKRVDGSITKAGNARCRTQLIEAAQHYKRTPKVTPKMKSDLSQVDASTASTAVKCLQRLHKRYWALSLRQTAPRGHHRYRPGVGRVHLGAHATGTCSGRCVVNREPIERCC